jgi:hypothetical protein
MMGVQKEPRTWQRIIWLVIIAAFLAVELQSISSDRREQQRQLASIIDAEKTSSKKAVSALTIPVETTRSDLEMIMAKLRTDEATARKSQLINNLRGFCAHRTTTKCWGTLTRPCRYSDQQERASNGAKPPFMAA